jgi:hypothetical protein
MAVKVAKKETPEAAVARRVKAFLIAKGWRPVRMQRMALPGQFSAGEPGMPDYLFLRYGAGRVAAVLWIEFKAPGARLGPKQILWMARERERGAPVTVVDDPAFFKSWYATEFAWLHDGRVRGQIEMFCGEGA